MHIPERPLYRPEAWRVDMGSKAEGGKYILIRRSGFEGVRNKSKKVSVRRYLFSLMVGKKLVKKKISDSLLENDNSNRNKNILD